MKPKSLLSCLWVLVFGAFLALAGISQQLPDAQPQTAIATQQVSPQPSITHDSCTLYTSRLSDQEAVSTTYVVSIDSDNGAYTDEPMIIWLISRATQLLLHKLWD